MERKDFSNAKNRYSEKDVEKRLVQGVEKRGGMCIKMLCYLFSGLPDREVLLPGWPAVFVELKSTGKKPRKIQKAVHERMRKIGFEVLVIDTFEQVDEFLQRYDAERE